jgi:hypothetical protein
MPKFEVKIVARVERTLTVTADNEDDAADEAQMLLEFETEGFIDHLEVVDVTQIHDADYYDFDDDGD